MRRLLLIALLAAPAFAAEPSKFTLAQSGATADPLTVLGPAAVCADQQIALWNGASNTSLQCSVLTVADTTGTLTGPAGGFSIIGGTGAADVLTLDGSLGTFGDVKVYPNGSIAADGGISWAGAIGSANSAGIEIGSSHYFRWNTLFLYQDSAQVLAQRNTTNAQTFRLYGTADAAGTFTNFARLSLAATDGTMTITTETAGTAADDQNLVVKGEGATATLTLDGSDDVAGSVTVTGSGRIQASSSGAGILELNWGGSGPDGLQFTHSGNPIWGFEGNLNTFEPFSSNVYDIGRDSLQVRSIYLGTSLIMEGTTANDYEVTLSGGDPTADRTITLPDATGTVLLNVRVVTPDIDGETTTLANSSTLWTNTGDGDGEAITLLNDPGIGVQYCFAVDVAQTITVSPSAGETLYYGTDQCVVSLTSNAIGSTLCVVAVTGGTGAKWFTISDKGTWTCND